MIRVLHLINGLEIGGAEILLFEVLRRIDRGRFDLHVASLLGPGRLGPRFEAAGIPVIDLSRRGRFTPRSVARLRQLLREHPCDILHAHLVHATLVARWLRRRRAVPVLVTSQHFPPLERGGFPRWIHRRTAHRDDMTVAVSASIARELIEGLGVPRAQVTVIENGIDLTRFRPGVEPMPREVLGAGAGDVLIGTAASLTPKKGLDVLVRAAGPVLRDHPQARFLIAGEGPGRAALERQIAAAGLAGRVRLLGAVDDVPRFLAALDLFCLPSRREPFGLSLAEAMACGIACVHSATGGMAALSEDGVSALQVRPHEDPTALAEALSRLIGDETLRRRLGEAAASRARGRFGIEQTVERLAALWESLHISPR